VEHAVGKKGDLTQRTLLRKEGGAWTAGGENDRPGEGYNFPSPTEKGGEKRKARWQEKKRKPIWARKRKKNRPPLARGGGFSDESSVNWTVE